MIAEGHQLIIQEDFNSEYEDLKPWMIDLGLIDLIGKKPGKGPRNHTRTKDAPIECIFGTSNFRIEEATFPLEYWEVITEPFG